MAPILWTIPMQPTGKPIRAALTINKIAFTMPTESEYKHFESNLKPEFKAKFPLGKIPAWEDKEKGVLLFEGATIARYVAGLVPNSTLLGSSAEDAALVDQWMHVADTEVSGHQTLIMHLTNGTIPGYSKPTHTYALARLMRGLTTINNHLKSRTFLVGMRLTVADLYVAAIVAKAFATCLGKDERKGLEPTVRWVETVFGMNREIYGDVIYCEKGAVFVPPKKEKEDKPKADKPKAEKPKKEAPKKKEVEKDDDDEEPLVPEEPKQKNPLDDLPKSTFNLEDWKRAYSNMETRGAGGALEWFYKNYDPAGFSIHRVSFKYPEELTQTFMSSNQITGFFNRLEASRKYLFASVGVLGKTNDSRIEGALVCRGSDVVHVVSVAPDYESYAYSPLDLEKAEDKAFFEGAMAWDLEIDGKAWVDGKNFK